MGTDAAACWTEDEMVWPSVSSLSEYLRGYSKTSSSIISRPSPTPHYTPLRFATKTAPSGAFFYQNARRYIPSNGSSSLILGILLALSQPPLSKCFLVPLHVCMHALLLVNPSPFSLLVASPPLLDSRIVVDSFCFLSTLHCIIITLFSYLFTTLHYLG